jgi:hypothetical protein
MCDDSNTYEDCAMKTYCIKYLNKTRLTTLIDAYDFEDAAKRFYSEGYKGRIQSVQLAK